MVRRRARGDMREGRVVRGGGEGRGVGGDTAGASGHLFVPTLAFSVLGGGRLTERHGYRAHRVPPRDGAQHEYLRRGWPTRRRGEETISIGRHAGRLQVVSNHSHLRLATHSHSARRTRT